MRKQFVKTIESIFRQDDSIVLLLGDIGVFGFRNIFKNYPERVYNIGILEQTMISVAAGLSKEGFHPVVHSIAPFVVERCFEQLKIDVGYQQFPINIVSVGASYDYSLLGSTHYCPGDVSLMLTIPGMNIFVPGSDQEFDTLFQQLYNHKNPNYFRLTERGNQFNIPVEFGKGVKIKDGYDGTVIAIGPMLEKVISACADINVTILYYTSIIPFDSDLLQQNSENGKIAVVEPFYEGSMAYLVCKAMEQRKYQLINIGIPRIFFKNYGCTENHDQYLKLDVENMRNRLNNFFYE